MKMWYFNKYTTQKHENKYIKINIIATINAIEYDETFFFVFIRLDQHHVIIPA